MIKIDRKAKEIVIMGTPVAPGNRGVMALGASLATLCRQEYPDSEVVFLQIHKPSKPINIQTDSGPYNVEVRTCRSNFKDGISNNIFVNVILSLLYKLIPIKSIRRKIASSSNWIKTISEALWVGDIRGGDSFSDIYGLGRFVRAFLPTLTVILIRGKITHLPQTYGPFKSKTATALGKFLLRHSDTIYARDPQSQQLAQNLIGTQPKVRLTPDVAFRLVAKVPEKLSTDPECQPIDLENAIGINPNALMYNGGYQHTKLNLRINYKSFLTSVTTKLLEIHEGPLLLIPHVYAINGDVESDNETCYKLKSTLSTEHQKRCIIVTGDYDQHELKGIIGKCEFFVGSRMHACIAALSQMVACAGVAYSMKFKGVFESAGATNCVIDGTTTDENTAVEEVTRLYKKKDLLKLELEGRIPIVKSNLNSLFKNIS